jgi:hypothetical protein
MDFDSLVDDSVAAQGTANQSGAPVAQQQAAAPQAPLMFDQLEDDADKYGTFSESVKAGLEGLAKGVAGPLATGAERLLGVSPEAMEARARVNPVTSMGAEAVGLIAPAIATLGASAATRLGIAGAAEALPAIQAATKFTQAGALEGLAASGTKALGLGAEGAGALSNIGSAAVKGAIENAAFQAGDEVSKQILHPEFTADAAASALTDIGGAGLIGGMVGGTFGAVPEIWKKTMGNQTSGVMHALAQKMGGIEGVVSDPVQQAVSRLGIDVEPEILASMSADPEIRAMASTLNQSDTTKSGLKFQEDRKAFQNLLNDKMVEALGKDAATVTSEFSEYNAGNKIGNTLADEYHERMAPIAQAFDTAREKYASAELGPSIAHKEVAAAEIAQGLEKELQKQGRALQKAIKAQDVAKATEIGGTIEQINQSLKDVSRAAKVPGISDVIAQDVAELVEREAWAGSDDIMKEVNRLQKRLPEIKTVNELQKEITTIGNNTASTLPFGQQTPLSRAGSMIRSVLREAEANAVARSMGAVEGVEAMNTFNANRKAFAEVAKLKDALDDRLKAGGSASGYAKGLRTMAQTDAESVFRRLSGKGDADLLQLLGNSFPRTAQAVREAHIDQLTAGAAKSAKAGETVSGTRLIKMLEDMANKSPELRNFVIPADAQGKIKAANTLIDALTDTSHNFSNTARTVDKLLNGLPGSAAALATGLMTHNPMAALLVGGLAKTLGKDVPDAVRLSLLKVLGSSKPIDSAALRATVDFAHSVIKGESAVMKGSKAVISGVGKVLPERLMVSERDREQLDKQVKKVAANPQALLERTDKLGHYMPEASQGMTVAAGRVANYLESIRPKPVKPGPFDREIEPSKADMSAYNRALTIAVQPLSVLEHVKDGTILPSDVKHLQAMYPEVYSRLSRQLLADASEHIAKGETMPYVRRQALSMFLGQPLDSTLSPTAIQAAQATFAAQQQQGQGAAPMPKVKHSTAPLGKLPKTLETGPQAREMRRNK